MVFNMHLNLFSVQTWRRCWKSCEWIKQQMVWWSSCVCRIITCDRFPWSVLSTVRNGRMHQIWILQFHAPETYISWFEKVNYIFQQIYFLYFFFSYLSNPVFVYLFDRYLYSRRKMPIGGSGGHRSRSRSRERGSRRRSRSRDRRNKDTRSSRSGRY